MLRVYIAGPLTTGDVMVNVARAMDAWHELADLGFAPYCPHLSAFLHIHRARGYEEWMAQDLAWLAACHALLRLPGESAGGDREEIAAFQHSIPVFYSVDALLNWKDRLAQLEEVR